MVQEPDGSRSFVLPRDQMPEPLWSLHLLDAAAVGTTLVLTSMWDRLARQAIATRR